MSNEISLSRKLEERVKELSCLYGVSSAIRKHSDSVLNTLEEICLITKQAWLLSDDAIVQLSIKDYNISTSEIPEKNISQQSEILVFGDHLGFIKVYYDTQNSHGARFLKEEQKLLDKIAIEISEFIERKEVAQKEELLRRSAERNDRLSILGEITAGIAHELNTPLGNILGFAELIKSNTQDDQTDKDTTKIIKAAIYSREIVKKLMFFACEMPQNKEFTQIKPIIDQALKLLSQNFQKAEIGYNFKIDNPSLEAQIDTIQFTQVLFNLLINAIYISPKKSIISVKVSNTSSHFIMEIIDEGPGIPGDLNAKIYEPFFTTKPVGEGSGLGLSVVHGIIKSHRGEIINFDNKPTGTVFQIKLPLKM
ncbi:sensor histidine kinase [Christiangramia sediminis]|uniref:histidine kinase n=1 Tax=Christiangramia sediminis TaxID=2881336 RepID=A0A9X1LHC2_9FLAO|nr:HAMP domain-containing sensor histidine kinase [Christiangramia sediminis]MCB7480339.1 HAMP domain-containing histidine kinase [Christiangramia sediminis]